MKNDLAFLLSKPQAVPGAGHDAGYLRISALHKRFGQHAVLKGLDLGIGKGEFVCLLGPSGCGKTTLLRQIAGLDQPDAGTIFMQGRDITRLPPSRRDYGIVFQSYALFPNLTAAENIAYGLRGRREDRARRVRELLALIDLESIEHRYPAQLSGGQQQRVALARALATSPSLLLLDEPLSALDARVREHLRGEIKALQEKLGITTIMVTHDQEEALLMADRVVVMNGGAIEQVGSALDVYREPASRFVADFVGQANWLAATVSGPGRVSLGSGDIMVAALPPLASAAKVELFLRPEDVTLHAHWPATPDAVLADIVKLELLGPIYRVHLAVPAWGSQTVRADITHARLHGLALTTERRVPVSLNVDRLKVFLPQGAAC